MTSSITPFHSHSISSSWSRASHPQIILLLLAHLQVRVFALGLARWFSRHKRLVSPRSLSVSLCFRSSSAFSLCPIRWIFPRSVAMSKTFHGPEGPLLFQPLFSDRESSSLNPSSLSTPALPGTCCSSYYSGVESRSPCIYQRIEGTASGAGPCFSSSYS